MTYRILIWLLLASPALACSACPDRAARVGFWVMLVPALIYGPAYGLRLAERYANVGWPTKLMMLSIFGSSWAAYYITTHLVTKFSDSGLEVGGYGLVVAHLAGSLPPLLSRFRLARPVIPPAID